MRPKVQNCIRYTTEKGHIGVRLVSGDHIETARAMAIRSTILRPEDLSNPQSIMHADDFRAAVGGIVSVRDEKTDEMELQLENMSAFREIAQYLKVLARASSSDKNLLVIGLQALGKSVAVTGEGINDVDSLKQANVGLAMGSGCSAAKDAADIVLLNDDFEACLKAIMWGRNIFHNVSRFLQFQLTVNISALLVIVAGHCILLESPISAVQLLWINLVMDTLAAVALGSEPPLPHVIQGSAFKHNVSVLSKTIWRQVIGISLWNFLVILTIMLFGQSFYGLNYHISDVAAHGIEPSSEDTVAHASWKASKDKLEHLTIIFNAFMFLCFWNEINCRKVGRRDFNVIENLFHNFYFVVVLALQVSVQFAMNWYLPSLTKQVPLPTSQFGGFIFIGFTSVLVSACLKLTPEPWVQRIPVQVMANEDLKINHTVLSSWR